MLLPPPVRSILSPVPTQEALAVQSIAGWLASLGLSEYKERFVENRIDFSVLPELTDQDLRDLNIALGDRRKMLRSIRALAAKPPETVPPSKTQSRDTAERRQLTVMFCDLVGSTA